MVETVEVGDTVDTVETEETRETVFKKIIKSYQMGKNMPTIIKKKKLVPNNKKNQGKSEDCCADACLRHLETPL